MSNDLQFMASVPVFLWVICNVYGEELVTNEVQSKTELYLYTTIVFMRNHLRKLSKYHHGDLVQLVSDRDFLKILMSLATLSAQTYMQNKVIFTEDDINKLDCPVSLEKTGFIVKTSGKTKVAKSVYQFRHLVLQEFLCALYLSVNENIEQFKGNRELTSCTPTILGINRLMALKDNHLFITLFKNLEISNSNFVLRMWSMLLRRLGFPWGNDMYIAERNRELTIPDSLVKDEKLVLNTFRLNSDADRFLDMVFESKYVNTRGTLKSAILKLRSNYTRELLLLQALDIHHIEDLECCFFLDLYNWKKQLEHFMKPIKLCAGSENVVTEIIFGRKPLETTPQIKCRPQSLILTISEYSKDLFKLPEEIKTISSTFRLTLKNDEDKYSPCHVDDEMFFNAFKDLILYAVKSKKYMRINLRQKLIQKFREQLLTFLPRDMLLEYYGLYISDPYFRNITHKIN